MSIQKKKKQKTSSGSGLFNSLDTYFKRNKNVFFVLSVLLTALFGLLLFDMKISDGGDDSAYIVFARKFLNGESFPSHLAAFYSIFLSLPLALFGVNVVLFKIFSFLFIIGHLVFFYYAFKQRISPTLLILVLLFISCNSHLLYFASQTYSEALFLFLQSLSLFFFFNLWGKIQGDSQDYFKHWRNWLAVGLFVFLLGITRMIGYSMLAAILVFLLFQKKYIAALYSLGSFLIFYVPYYVYKKIVWGASSSTRLELVLYKNVYNKAAGTEDFAGMVTRFTENAKIYLSRHFPTIIGLKNPTNTDKSMLLVIILLALFLVALVICYRRHKIMFFVSLYLGAAITGTFITLQQSWGQERMILVYVPLILLLFSYTIYEIAQRKKFRFLGVFLLLLFVFMEIKSFGYTLKKAKANSKILAKNIRGDMFYGLTPDWINFLKLSQMCGEKLPEDVMVASRKPSMSFIYGKGKEFYGIYRIPTVVPDTIINNAAETSDTLLFLKLNELDKIKDLRVQFALKSQLHAIVYRESDRYGIFNYERKRMQSLLEFIRQHDLYNTLDPDEFLQMLGKGKGTVGAVLPDELLEKLRKARVQYVIVANLRINPKMKTKRTINTVRRYMYFIQYKYPAILTKVYQVGDKNNEPAEFYQINYAKYGMQLPDKED